MSSDDRDNLEQTEIKLNSSDGVSLFREHFKEQYDEFEVAAQILLENNTEATRVRTGREKYEILQKSADAAEAALQGDQEP